MNEKKMKKNEFIVSKHDRFNKKIIRVFQTTSLFKTLPVSKQRRRWGGCNCRRNRSCLTVPPRLWWESPLLETSAGEVRVPENQ